jgi:hypothetical protein
MGEEKTNEVELWEPPLTKSARAAYYDESPFVLMYGERGTGKSMGAYHKAIKHAYRYNDALVLIITRIRAESGGAWEDITSQAEWDSGPLKGQPKGILETWRRELNIEYGNFSTAAFTETLWTPYKDSSQNIRVDIRNQHKGVSRIYYKSMENASQLIDRIKDIKPSFILIEELSNFHDPAYFTAIVQQLGRRGSVPHDAQQYVGTCNPAKTGQKHWVYKQFFVLPHKLRQDAIDKLETHTFNPSLYHPQKNPEGDILEWNQDYSVYHVKMTENQFMAPEVKANYISRLVESARHNPAEYERSIEGKWVPDLQGEALFSGFWVKINHMFGDPRKNTGFMPKPGAPCLIGYDPGNVNNARVFMQRHHLPNRGASLYRVFDDLVFTDRKLKIETLVKAQLDLQCEWVQRCGFIIGWLHISDEQALTHWNHHGSYEFQQIHKWSTRLIEETPRYQEAGLRPIVLLAPKKGANSKTGRVESIRDKLLSERLLVSARARATIAMFDELRSDPKNSDHPMKARDGHIHTFDALSYPIYYFDLRGDVDVRVDVDTNEKELAYVSAPS